MDLLLTSLLLLLSYMFLSAGRLKFSHLNYSAEAIAEYQLTPKFLNRHLAIFLACVEVVLAVALIVPPSRALAIVVAVGLLAVYALAISINLLRGRRRLDCGCNGPNAKQLISWWLPIRNAGLIVLLVACYQAPINVSTLFWLLALVCSVSLILLQQGLKQLYKNQKLMSAR